ncbi:hypothetical protein DFP72DRAFT_936547 [Ephemerocybe angulata]|uniref:GATA-type domain-containing protein n=1 Tax=Ephemerocybe angulata TaxID=980116 RepID=A0A8H6HAU1_9AGAR|nr:hypothetical protein DFP72DRAFT_936547 [Tulosesus angulatus]
MEPAEIPDPPSPAPQPSPIPPRSNALPGEASPFGLFGDFSLGSAEQTACTGTKRCSRCHTTSTPLWRFDRTTDEPLCEACYLTPGNEVKQPVSSTSSQATPTTKHCSRCNTTTTDIWRRDPTTLAPLCSACNMVESG